MEKLFAKANEKFVKSVILYANEENVLCFDSEATDKVSAAILKNLFNKNLVLIKTEDGLVRPTHFAELEDFYTVSVVVVKEAAASVVTFKSDALPVA